ncbi:hypothetical protein F0344_33940 [Streptomyces finlayi]|uniref:Transcriptional regulator LacI/GalR-like sensor domain-containing protein n=2 Tax=Streptomyces finlayi TaxID=67296 RepID=A0A7G7BUB3_9ACTN|nr:hypothetical protein F0344_33940 [Streptomyces finlayi]
MSSSRSATVVHTPCIGGLLPDATHVGRPVVTVTHVQHSYGRHSGPARPSNSLCSGTVCEALGSRRKTLRETSAQHLHTTHDHHSLRPCRYGSVVRAGDRQLTDSAAPLSVMGARPWVVEHLPPTPRPVERFLARQGTPMTSPRAHRYVAPGHAQADERHGGGTGPREFEMLGCAGTSRLRCSPPSKPTPRGCSPTGYGRCRPARGCLQADRLQSPQREPLGRQLASRPDVTAVFASNDHMALGVLRALQEAGRRVPDDVSVVGYDDIPEAPYLLPPLTTVHNDFAETGRRALDLLLRELRGDGGAASTRSSRSG